MDVELTLGETIDPATSERTGQPLGVDAADLTTHGVIVGMTGSGKTGLGVVLIEEALRSGIPTLVLDPKGDMTNLALRFPGLSAEEFAPWVPAGTDATAAARDWKEGLASWALDGSDIAALDHASRVTVYTPGSTASVPLNLVGSLAPPADADDEARADEIDGLVGGLLSMVGIDADPLSSREHILLSNLVDRAWSEGTDLDLGRLVQQVQQPPLRKLGVLDVESFYPATDRAELALKLNGLLASPSFAAWAEGLPLDIGAMLAPGGPTPCSVVYLAHLSEEERQFVVTLVLSKLVTWMRSQPGSPQLRALVYMDEVFGYLPPTAEPPAKRPILTILKQARAYGVGMVLSTQNPVDVDYKALSNAGTWVIGRLQTERDVDRLRDGLRAASGSVDVGEVAATIAALGKREFLLHSTRASAPTRFTSRWALDYLAGPLTRDQLQTLPGQPDAADVGGQATSSADAARPMAARPLDVGEHESTVPPTVAEGVPVRWADPAAPWLPDVGGDPTSTRLRPAVAVRVGLLFDDTKADLRHTEEFECILVGPGEHPDLDELVTVDYDNRDLLEAAPERAVYELPDAPVDAPSWFRDVERAVTEHLYGNRTVSVSRNEALGLWSRPGEAAEEFAARCRAAADERAEQDAAKLRSQLERKMHTIRRAIEREQTRVEELRARQSDAKQHEVISAAGDLLGSFLGGRRSARSVLSKAKGVSSRRKQSSAAAQRVETAVAKLEQRGAELADLEAELVEALADVEAGWAEKAEQVEPVEIGLEKSDIDVRQVTFVWIPT